MTGMDKLTEVSLLHIVIGCGARATFRLHSHFPDKIDYTEKR